MEKPGHVGAGLGADDVRAASVDARDGADQLPERAKGFDRRLDPLGDRLDGVGVAVDQIRVLAGKARVMVTEPSGQCFGQGRDPRPKAMHC